MPPLEKTKRKNLILLLKSSLLLEVKLNSLNNVQILGKVLIYLRNKHLI